MHTEVCAARFKEENYANPVADLTDDSCNRMEKPLLLWTTVIPKFHNTTEICLLFNRYDLVLSSQPRRFIRIASVRRIMFAFTTTSCWLLWLFTDVRVLRSAHTEGLVPATSPGDQVPSCEPPIFTRESSHRDQNLVPATCPTISNHVWIRGTICRDVSPQFMLVSACELFVIQVPATKWNETNR